MIPPLSQPNQNIIKGAVGLLRIAAHGWSLSTYGQALARECSRELGAWLDDNKIKSLPPEAAWPFPTDPRARAALTDPDVSEEETAQAWQKWIGGDPRPMQAAAAPASAPQQQRFIMGGMPDEDWRPAAAPQVPQAAQPLFAVAVAQRKWESLQGDGYRMQRIEFARSVDGYEQRGSINPWGKVLWVQAAGVAPTAQRIPDEGWKALAESLMELLEISQRTKELAVQYGLEEAAGVAQDAPTLPDGRLQLLAHSIKRLGLEIFDGPECPQAVRDAIEWFAAELSVSQLPKEDEHG